MKNPLKKRGPTPLTITIGVDLGARVDPSAIVVAEQFEGDRHRVHTAERIALKTTYPEVAARIKTVYEYAVRRLAAQQVDDALRESGYLRDPSMDEPADIRARESVYAVCDATGCGGPVVDYLRESADITPRNHLTAVWFTAGARCTVRRGAMEGSVSKSHPVSRLQSLIGFGRIEWPKTDAGRALVDELENFDMDVNNPMNPTWNARVGHHDDLVCAAALAVLLDDAKIQTGSCYYDFTPIPE